jgi:hypothetical protein
LPPQPAYDQLVKELERSRSEQLEYASNAEFNLTNETIDAYNQQSVLNQSVVHTSHITHSTPLKLPPAADSTPLRPEGARGSRRRGQGNVDSDVTEKMQEVFSININNNNAINTDVHKTPSRNKNPVDEDETPRRGLKPSMPAPLAAPPTPTATEQSPAEYKGVGTPVSAIKSTTNLNAKFPTNAQKEQAFNLLPNTIEHIATSAQLNPEALLLHPSDSQVKPIVGNKAIETIESIDFIDSNLTFESMLGNDRISQLSQTDLELHLTQVKLNRFLFFVWYDN